MQYTVARVPKDLDLDGIAVALTAFDPSAIVDLDRSGSVLRLSTVLGTAEIVPLLKSAGLPLVSADVDRVPSECCGGCGG